jgi:hypothetical protein
MKDIGRDRVQQNLLNHLRVRGLVDTDRFFGLAGWSAGWSHPFRVYENARSDSSFDRGVLKRRHCTDEGLTAYVLAVDCHATGRFS